MGLTTTSEAFEFKIFFFLRNSSRQRLLRLCRELSLLAGNADVQDFSGAGLPLGVSSGCSAQVLGLYACIATLAEPGLRRGERRQRGLHGLGDFHAQPAVVSYFLLIFRKAKLVGDDKGR